MQRHTFLPNVDFVLLGSRADVRASRNFTKNQEQPLVLKYLKFNMCSQALSPQSQWAKQTDYSWCIIYNTHVTLLLSPEQKILKDTVGCTQHPWHDTKQKIIPQVIKTLSIQAFFSLHM